MIAGCGHLDRLLDQRRVALAVRRVEAFPEQQLAACARG
jgi:hypothetical protein